MWKFIRHKIANNSKVKKMSEAERKRIGGKFIMFGTLTLLVPLTAMMFSYQSLLMHVVSQVVWISAMIVGCGIAFESGEKHQGRDRAKR
ncbi:hypothetical protein [Serratia fonticola]|uniref:hypothetical protein n=1 Tax=Serratia fonticola TaxID=47917 RepID=UPI001415435E|nr:hypothetical protein [Serratia fonticola]QIP94481.1 hypothetical protein HAP32_05109 [Serratia fonticola]